MGRAHLAFSSICCRPGLLEQMLNGAEATFLLSVLFHKLLRSTGTALTLEWRHAQCKKALWLTRSLAWFKAWNEGMLEKVLCLRGASKVAH